MSLLRHGPAFPAGTPWPEVVHPAVHGELVHAQRGAWHHVAVTPQSPPQPLAIPQPPFAFGCRVQDVLQTRSRGFMSWCDCAGRPHAVCVRAPFITVATQYRGVCTDCVHLSLIRRQARGCAHHLAVVNNGAVNTGVQISVQVPAFSFLGYTPRSGVAGSHGDLTLIFSAAAAPPRCLKLSAIAR